MLYLCFFFSSRRRHTRYIGDWSSDVCSSDLDKDGANRDSGIRNVEGRPRIENSPGKEMKIDLDEIGDGAVEDAVGDVASGTPEKKRQACGVKGADAASGDEQPGDNCDDDEGAADKEHAQSGRGKTGEKTESDAGVA